jgi:hypothetical protein
MSSSVKDEAVVAAPLLRVFVSSVIDGFEEFREAARKGIEATGAHAVLVNENFPALNSSARNACLDGIESCDYVVSIAGARGGWRAPSGLLVVEEEFEHACRSNIPVLAFVQATTRDPDSTRFVNRLSDYVDGRFRIKFQTPAELQIEIERALRERLGPTMKNRTEDRDLGSFFPTSDRYSVAVPKLRFVIAPERMEELIDPVRLASPELLQKIYELAHSAKWKLFTFEQKKTHELKGSTLSIIQSDKNSSHNDYLYRRLDVNEDGVLAIETSVTRPSPAHASWDMTNANVVAIEDLEMALSTDFGFSGALFDFLDPFKRQERFYFNVELSGLGYRTLERNPQTRSSMIMSARGFDQIRVYELSRLVSRNILGEAEEEVKRATTILERKAAE